MASFSSARQVERGIFISLPFSVLKNAPTRVEVVRFEIKPLINHVNELRSLTRFRNFLYSHSHKHDRMNTKILTGNRKMLAMILSVAVIATIGGSLAFAQTAGSTGQSSTTTTPPKIQGSVNLQQLLLSNVQTKFTDAANTAAGAVANGQVIAGSLAVIQGSVVYNFKVIDGTNIYSVIVDAGNGKVLYTSTGHAIQLGGLLGMGGGGMGHYGMMGKHHMGMGGGAWKSQQPSSTPSPAPTATQ